MKDKKQKGEYGYRNYYRRVQLAKVLFGTVMILLQLGARRFVSDTAVKNILTVMAVLSVLPTANIASPLLAAWKYKTPSEEFYNKILCFKKKGSLLFDLVITTKDSVLPIDALIVHPMGIYAFYTGSKSDFSKPEHALNEIFAAHRLEQKIKIIKDECAFIRHLEGLKEASEYEDDGSMEYAEGLLKNLSM